MFILLSVLMIACCASNLHSIIFTDFRTLALLVRTHSCATWTRRTRLRSEECSKVEEECNITAHRNFRFTEYIGYFVLFSQHKLAKFSTIYRLLTLQCITHVDINILCFHTSSVFITQGGTDCHVCKLLNSVAWPLRWVSLTDTIGAVMGCQGFCYYCKKKK